MLPTLIVVILCLSCSGAYEYNGTILFGASSNSAAQSVSIRTGIQLHNRWLNDRGGIVLSDGRRMNISTIFLDDRGNNTILIQNYKYLSSLVANGNITAMIGPASSGTCAMAVTVTESKQKMLLCPSMSDEFISTARHSYTVATTASKYYFSPLQTLKLKKATRVSALWLVATGLVTCSAQAMSYFQSAVSQIELTLAAALTLSYQDDTQLTNLLISNFNDLKGKTDGIVVCAPSRALALLVLNALKMSSYSPLLFFIPFGVFTAADLSSGLVDFQAGLLQWTPELKYTDAFFGTSADFVKYFNSKIGRAPAPYDVFGFIASLALHQAIQSAGVLDPNAVEFAFSRLRVNTFYGPLTFGVDGTISRDLIVVQVQKGGTLAVISPDQAASAEIIYPIPTWDERIFSISYMDSVSQSVFALGLAVITILTALGIVLFWKRRTVIMKASSWKLCLLLVTGALMVCISVLMWFPYTTVEMCILQRVLFGIGTVLWFGSLLLKTWRIQHIFNSTKLKPGDGKKVKDKYLFKLLILFLIIDSLILIIWMGGSQPLITTTVVDPNRASLNYLSCSSADSTLDQAMSIIFIIEKAFLCVGMTILAIKVRNAPSKFNEAKAIALCAYNMVIGVAVIFAVVYFGQSSSDPSSRRFVFLFRNIAILLLTLSAMGILFGPKIWLIFVDEKAGKVYTWDGETHSGTTVGTAASVDKDRIPSHNGMKKTHIATMNVESGGGSGRNLVKDNFVTVPKPASVTLKSETATPPGKPDETVTHGFLQRQVSRSAPPARISANNSRNNSPAMANFVPLSINEQRALVERLVQLEAELSRPPLKLGESNSTAS